MKKKRKTSTEVADLQNQLKRVLADYDNLTKRVERQQEAFGTVAKVRMLSDLLPAIDMFDKADAHLGDTGLAMAMQALDESLKLQGFERIDTKEGDMFDENLHEAVDVVENQEMENGTIIEVKLVGWTLGEEVVRPAKVVVNRKN